MRIPLAWHNTFQNKKRTLAAVGGITFSLVLIFMQLGFLVTARITAGLVYDFFDFDLIVASTAYESMNAAGDFDKTRLYQAKAVPGVGETAYLNYANTRWRDPDNNNAETSCMLLGVETNPNFIRDEKTKANLSVLSLKDHVILDEWSHPDYGEKRIGKRAMVNWKEVNIAALYQLGISFHAEGSVLAGLDTFQSIVQGDPRKMTFGLIKVSPGAAIGEVKERLRSTLPGDVLIFDRQEFIRARAGIFHQGQTRGHHVSGRGVCRLCRGNGHPFSGPVHGDRQSPAGIRHVEGHRLQPVLYLQGGGPAGPDLRDAELHPGPAPGARRRFCREEGKPLAHVPHMGTGPVRLLFIAPHVSHFGCFGPRQGEKGRSGGSVLIWQ